ncbi:hypothetical protein ACRBEV_17805 [Methylobacterium phyllosphaerae]
MHPQTLLSRSRPHRAAAWLAAGLALALVWALGATYLIVFHDDVLAGFVARQAALRDAYETRIGELQDRLDRDRDDRAGSEAGLADRVAAALAHQAEMERRMTALAGLERQAQSDLLTTDPLTTDPLTTGALPDLVDAPRDAVRDGLVLRPSEGAAAERPATHRLPRRSAREVETGLIWLEARLEGVQAAQGERLAHLGARAGDAVRRLRGLIGRTGLDPDRLDTPAQAAGLGGPLVPLDGRVLDGAGFAEGLALARRTLDDGQRLRRLAATLPLGRPIRGPRPCRARSARGSIPSPGAWPCIPAWT